jgi:ribosomal protein S18 acetylase RimI-like enzyme
MIKTTEIHNPTEKSKICNSILRALPSWFGVESSIRNYTEQVQSMPFYAAVEGGDSIGFVALKIHNLFTAEICVMGVLTDYHRQKIGQKLLEHCEKYCTANKIEFLTVKTLDESRESNSYKNTRLFYQAMGFKPLEVFPLLWDKDNPCLFMVKSMRHPLP